MLIRILMMKIVFKGHHQSRQSQALKLNHLYMQLQFSLSIAVLCKHLSLFCHLLLVFPQSIDTFFNRNKKKLWLRRESNSPWVRQGQELTTDKKKSRKSHCCLRKMHVAFGRTLPKLARCLPRPNSLIIPIRQPGSQRNANLNNCQERYQSSSRCPCFSALSS